MKVQKVCPVIIRENESRKEILAFRHPIGGDIQLVKGTIEPGENFEAAALRELREESGIEKVSSIEFKGVWEPKNENQIWHFFHCQPQDELPENWSFFANDDGGLNFSFFWFDLNEKPSDEWHPVFQEALCFINQNFTH